VSEEIRIKNCDQLALQNHSMEILSVNNQFCTNTVDSRIYCMRYFIFIIRITIPGTFELFTSAREVVYHQIKQLAECHCPEARWGRANSHGEPATPRSVEAPHAPPPAPCSATSSFAANDVKTLTKVTPIRALVRFSPKTCARHSAVQESWLSAP
jgi:hypothetical protein